MGSLAQICGWPLVETGERWGTFEAVEILVGRWCAERVHGGEVGLVAGQLVGQGLHDVIGVVV